MTDNTEALPRTEAGRALLTTLRVGNRNATYIAAMRNTILAIEAEATQPDSATPVEAGLREAAQAVVDTHGCFCTICYALRAALAPAVPLKGAMTPASPPHVCAIEEALAATPVASPDAEKAALVEALTRWHSDAHGTNPHGCVTERLLANTAAAAQAHDKAVADAAWQEGHEAGLADALTAAALNGSLDKAWRDAEAALHEGATIDLRFTGEEWLAYEWGGAGRKGCGSTPTEALQALVKALKEK